MADDKRMDFIRNAEAVRNEDAELHIIECEIAADVPVIGELQYGPYHFIPLNFWDERYKRTERALLLRIYSRLPGSLFIAKELVVLASLFLRKRFQFRQVTRYNDMPFPSSRSEHSRWIDEVVAQGEAELLDLSNCLQLVEGLDSNYHQEFLLAARLYNRALLMIEDQPDMAYLDLISAIEVLCKDADIGNPQLSWLGNRKLENLVNSIENQELRIKIEKNILQREHFTRRKFAKFILDHMEEDFWLGDRVPEHSQIRPDQIPKLLKDVYDQRSRTLHNGEVFPEWIFWSASKVVSELPPMYDMIPWKSRQLIPHPSFFEKLVNHVLKNFLKRNQISESEDGG